MLIVKNPPTHVRRQKRHRFDPWVGKIPWILATHCSILPGESHRPGELQSMGLQRV